MSPSQQQLRTPVPDRHNDLVPLPQRLQRVPAHPRQTQITNLDDSRGGDEDVCGFQVAVEDVVGVEVEDAVDELVEKRLQGGEG